MHFVYTITYVGNILVFEWEINSLIIVWLCILKKMLQIMLIVKLSYDITISKYKNLWNEILKLYAFVYVFIL